MTLPFKRLPARYQEAIEAAPYDRWLTGDGEVAAQFHRTAAGFLLRFPGRADFVLAHEDLRVTCIPAPEISPQLIFDLFHNQVVPLIRNRAGELVLHASAVAAPSGVLGFVGGSGLGKSTLAAGLARAGHPFLTDDGLVLKPDAAGYLAAPERAYLRLWADSNRALFSRDEPDKETVEKVLVDAGPALPFLGEPAALRHLYLLGDGSSGTVIIRRMNRAAAMVDVIKHAFILDVDDRPRLQAHFQRLAEVAEAVPCFTLDFPRRYEELPRVIAAILAHAAHGAASS